ncbi:hypothetical protein ABFT80_26700 [Mesorhizobium sp. SB112]|uniref:hypothetical protein n=1 Tax=Mesorhizobium sp. SB112 TaxID=3151853 RepID=UPI003264E4D8
MMNKVFTKKQLALSELRHEIGSRFDLFICAASYEGRCLSAPMSVEDGRFKKVIILKNEDVADPGAENAKRLVEHFKLSGASVVTITKSIAIRTADQIAKQIDSCQPIAAAKICVDTTCMTHEALLILLSLLRHIFADQFSHIRFLYVPAKEYDPGTPDAEKWLSRGIKDVRSVLGYPGKLLPSRRNRLLVLVGFEVNRTSSLINVYEPASLQLGYGSDALNPEHQRVNRQKFDRLVEMHPLAGSFEFSPADAYSVRDAILKDAYQHSDLNLIVAPMNTKISTVGAALAVMERPEIQLCYASASTYNSENYSLPDDRVISFTV